MIHTTMDNNTIYYSTITSFYYIRTTSQNAQSMRAYCTVVSILYFSIPLVIALSVVVHVEHENACGQNHPNPTYQRPPPPRGVNKVLHGGLRPEVQPLPFYTPFLIEKVPLLYDLHRKWFPFHIPTECLLLNGFTSETP